MKGKSRDLKVNLKACTVRIQCAQFAHSLSLLSCSELTHWKTAYVQYFGIQWALGAVVTISVGCQEKLALPLISFSLSLCLFRFYFARIHDPPFKTISWLAKKKEICLLTFADPLVQQQCASQQEKNVAHVLFFQQFNCFLWTCWWK